MDQIFERLEKLVKAWVNSGVSSSPSYDRAESRKTYGDSDLDAAMAELDDFLDTSKTDSERREAEEKRAQAEKERRAREEQSRRYRSASGSGASAASASASAVIEDAYKYLGLVPYAPFADVKAAYKKLLFKYHPDRNASSPEILKKSTETSTRINAAYQIIETYEESKKVK